MERAGPVRHAAAVGRGASQHVAALRRHPMQHSMRRSCRAQGLRFIHSHGLVHLDLKPGNIFLATRMEDADSAKVRGARVEPAAAFVAARTSLLPSPQASLGGACAHAPVIAATRAMADRPTAASRAQHGLLPGCRERLMRATGFAGGRHIAGAECAGQRKWTELTAIQPAPRDLQDWRPWPRDDGVGAACVRRRRLPLHAT